ncbi:hypothetical protein [Candidatus Similichlamydia epinepheli]|uniref:hypothetical protein n=1 Tax=Candidatus Similichlamydia epinepheli TaxID=1903953 RepID=UPI0013003852|nr:hypothetical protein [Candidatus Similichlamydia epinepheli]
MKTISRLHVLFLICSIGINSLHGNSIKVQSNLDYNNHQTKNCISISSCILTKEEMKKVQGGAWPLDSMGPISTILEAASVIGFAIYKSITQKKLRSEQEERRQALEQQRAELLREVEQLRDAIDARNTLENVQ